MTKLEFRPRYKFKSPLSTVDITTRVEKSIDTDNPENLLLKKVHDHLVLELPPESRHYWSPHMDVNLEEEGGETMVRCMIGPAPTVWTLFMFFYGFFGFASFVGLTLGMSQWTLNKEMWGFWILPAALVGMTVMYFISYEGKKLARDEMRTLKQFFDRALGCDCFQLAVQQDFD